MSISSIGSSGFNAVDFAAFRKQQFQKTDTNSDGSINREELAAGLKNAPKPSTDANASVPDVDEMFSRLDTDGDDQLTEAEMEAGLSQPPSGNKSGSAAGAPSGPPPAGGPPPSGGAGKAQGASSSEEDEEEDYDVKDLNKDGTVSMQEELVYGLTHPEQDDESSSTGKTTADSTPGSLLNTSA